MIPVEHYIILSAALFAVGLITVIIKKNAIVVLMGIEFMLNAANINLVVFSRLDKDIYNGQIFSLFVIVLAAAEAAVALAIIIHVYRHFGTSNVDEVNRLKG